MEKQLSFLIEIDKLKNVIRKSPLIDRSRRENSAEHSWHLALYALVLSGEANVGVNIDRVIRMLLLHDIVEIDAGDHPIHESNNSEHQRELELNAARRIFGLLPSEQAKEFMDLWLEFESGESDDAVKQALHENGLVWHILFVEGSEPDHGGRQHGEGQAIGENDSDSHDLTKILYRR